MDEPVDTVAAPDVEDVTEHERVSPSVKRRFHSGQELGSEDATEIMRSRYAHLIAILGPWDVGKTCILSSLYLTAACGGLKPDYLFAGSQTLQGFEDRARRARTWSGNALPTKLADHTILLDSRSAGLLHLALQETRGRQRRLELLFTDLPGEWTKDLINRASEAEKFKFLNRADGIILVVDGPLLVSEDRYAELERAQLLAQRLAETVQLDRTLPIVIAVSKCDKLGMVEPPAARDLLTFVTDLGFRAELILTAAFSSMPDTIENATGILELVRAIIDKVPDPVLSPVNNGAPVRSRHFESFKY